MFPAEFGDVYMDDGVQYRLGVELRCLRPLAHGAWEFCKIGERRFEEDAEDHSVMPADAEPREPSPMDEMLSIRATPMNVGGEAPWAWFRSPLEDGFGIELSIEQARELGALLYREVDIVAFVSRGADGRIECGRLTSWELVEDGDPRPAWREWYRSVS